MNSAPAPAYCPACGQPNPPGSRFCTGCGGALGAGAPAARRASPLPWVLGASLMVLLVALLFRGGAAPDPGPAPANDAAPAATPPDISNLSPRERFDRLYQRVISAAQQGDQATVTRFTPMALAAFGMLDTVDADARYHVAMLQLHVGDVAAAAAQADSIKQTFPDHLFGYVVAAAAARWQGDSTTQAANYREFLGRVERELQAGRPEYEEHRAMLEELRKTAAR